MDAISPTYIQFNAAQELLNQGTTPNNNLRDEIRHDQQNGHVIADFESIFYSLMLKTMRNTLTDGGLFGKEDSDTYGGMFDLCMSQHLAQAHPLGIGQMVESYLESSGSNESLANNP